ncbi:MAG: carboxypeptidase regulatory-like domain-containing protein [Ferruginibacter sp.]|nr:carboxypeptidase regulatory-like domain-containing protein [Ferruginibacter sp.]
MLLKKLFPLLLFLFSAPFMMTGQVTTSSITGVVKNVSGEVLPASSVVITHTPTGTVYKTSSNKNGKFDVVNLIPGGPYAVEISYVGYTKFSESSYTLPLGENTRIDVVLSTSSTTLNEVVISGRQTGGFNARKKTGASTSISKEQIAALPTLSRSIQDYTRLTPQANGNSFGGASNRFNNITIDGAVNNDVFGLSGSGTPGGQANTTAISLDAIQEIQVVLAPYDVSYGNFTGAGVNAVTRSGTNNLEGSVYYFLRNQNTIGKDPVTRIKSTTFSDKQYGLRFGGPIIKNKLFFFVNGELARRTQPTLFNAGETGSLLTTPEAQQLTDTLRIKYNYDAGTFNTYDAQTQSDKIFGRIDWNISAQHRLTVRHNYIKAFDDNISRSNSLFRYGNNTYRFNNTQHITVAELRSRISKSVSNNLIIGRHEIRDFRSTLGQLFPSIEISKGSGTIQLGSERSSTANELDQDIFEITDNVKIFSGKNTFTVGTHNEFFKFRNLFISNLNGRWRFASLQDFYANQPRQFDVTFSANKTVNEKPASDFKAAQLGFYAQDEIQFNPKFRLTLGLRVDMPIINSRPGYNKAVDSTFGGLYNTQNIPNKQLLLAPRIGFNYDLEGDKSLIIRGGVGIFTGRVPFVWISNQFGNTGLLLKATSQTDNTPNAAPFDVNGGNGFNPNVSQQSSIGTSPAGASYDVTLIDKKFKLPQVLRINAAADVKLPGEVNLTLEAIVSKTLNNVLYQDVNLKPATGVVDPAYNNGFDKRIAYGSSNALRRINQIFNYAILMRNTNEGYTLNLGATVNKTWKHFFTQFTYNFNSATDVNSGASSTALSNFEFVQVVGDPNSPKSAISNYQLQHRFTGVFSVNYEYFKHLRTSLSFFYNGNSGQPFTYLVNGDLNSDSRFGNDLIYVPNNPSEIKFVDRLNTAGTAVLATAAQQATDFEAFIANDPYLSKRRGNYSERNGRSTPWEHVVDARFAQDFFLTLAGKKHDFQFTFDVFNITNLLNNDWGRQYFVTNQAYSVLSTINRTTGAFIGKGFNFNNTQLPWSMNFGSRWQGQVGVRYTFN